MAIFNNMTSFSLPLGVCQSARKEDITKYIVYYLEANLHLLDKASERVSFHAERSTLTIIDF